MVLPPASYTASDCAGKVPIVVGVDAAAQSDLYSAVTLAGVIDTDCIVLAGARDESMSADQRARLDAAAAGGFIVGGTAAVPDAKVAGRDLTRLDGTDRWHTARLVGSQARTLAGDDSSAADASAGAEDPTTDCTGDVPIVAASDDAAQSDLYSAVTLAGVIGTDCIVLAGARDEPMPTAQRTRLDAAAPGGFIVGGRTAVPDAKLASREMTRLAGADRWNTAQLVGNQARAVASGEATASGETEGLDEGFTSVSVGLAFLCGLRTDGTIDCWGSDWHGQISNVPEGKFTQLDAGGEHACALRTNGTIECWGDRTAMPGGGIAVTPPAGEFSSVSAGFGFVCGLRSDHTVVCWPGFIEQNDQSQGPIGDFESVSASLRQACGIRTDGTVACWAHPWSFSNGQWHTSSYNRPADVIDFPSPSGRYSQVPKSSSHACALRTDGVIECWGANYAYQASPATRTDPARGFVFVDSGCALRGDGSKACWRGGGGLGWSGGTGIFQDPQKTRLVDLQGGCGLRSDGAIQCGDGRVLDGRYQKDLDRATSYSLCAIETSAEVVCWNDNWDKDSEIDERWSGKFDAIGGDCGLQTDRTIACSPAAEEDHPDHGRDWYWDISYIPSGKFTDVDANLEFGCGIRTSGVLACWGYFDSYPTNVKNRPPTGTFMQVEVGNGQVCGLRTDARPVCWNREGIVQSPSGDFTAIDESGESCAVRSDTTVVCWGHLEELPPYEFPPRLRDIGESIDR